jgi:renalase
MHNKEVIIIGAGIAGLLCADRLQKQGIDVAILEKNTEVGGRMATTRIGKGWADNGVQFFTVRDLRFQMYVDDWLHSGICKTWFVSEGSELGAQGYVRYCGTTGMTDAPKSLAENLDIRLETPVQKITYDGKHWSIWVNGQPAYTSKTLFLTAPLPQSLQLLESGKAECDVSIHNELKGIRYSRGIVMMAELDAGSALSDHGGLRIAKDPIRWIADNQIKGVSPDVPTLTIHATAQFSQTHWDSPEKIAVPILLEAVQSHIGAKIIKWQLHRWQYAFPINSWHDLFYRDAERNLFLAGDAFGGPRVEGAALSGIQAADEYLDSSEA